MLVLVLVLVLVQVSGGAGAAAGLHLSIDMLLPDAAPWGEGHDYCGAFFVLHNTCAQECVELSRIRVRVRCCIVTPGRGSGLVCLKVEIVTRECPALLWCSCLRPCLRSRLFL